MTDLPPEPRSPNGRWPLLAVAAALAWVLLRLPFLVADTVRAQPDAWLQARAALELSPDQRIALATGLQPAGLALLRDALPANGRMVLFCPYDGREMEAFLRTQFERVKNLLYPAPRDVYFAQGAAALAAEVTPAMAGRLVVLDGTQEGGELPVVGEFELLGELPLGAAAPGAGPRLRLWLLRRAP